MEIMELIMEACIFANKRSDAQMKQAYAQIEPKIQAMQDVIDAAIFIVGIKALGPDPLCQCNYCNSLRTILKYKETALK